MTIQLLTIGIIVKADTFFTYGLLVDSETLHYVDLGLIKTVDTLTHIGVNYCCDTLVRIRFNALLGNISPAQDLIRMSDTFDPHGFICEGT